MVEEWFSGSGSGSDPGSGSGQVLTCGPIRLKGPKRQYFPNFILKSHVHLTMSALLFCIIWNV